MEASATEVMEATAIDTILDTATDAILASAIDAILVTATDGGDGLGTLIIIILVCIYHSQKQNLICTLLKIFRVVVVVVSMVVFALEDAAKFLRRLVSSVMKSGPLKLKK